MALCAERTCENLAAKRSKFCSLACADKCVDELLKRIRETRRRFSVAEIQASGYIGEASARTIRALRNPFGVRSAAHVAFELFRESGHGPGLHREEVIDRLVDRCHQKGIALSSPRACVKRSMTEIRSRGYELVKDEEGHLGLTGRRADPSMNRCRDCRSWEDVSGGGVASCDNDKLRQFADRRTLDGVALEPYTAEAFFGPEFGCVHWEALRKEDGGDE